jgi:hypothetical protein
MHHVLPPSEPPDGERPRRFRLAVIGGDPPTVSPSEAGLDSTEGGVDTEGAAAPPIDV